VLKPEPFGSALIQLAQSGLIFEYANRYCFRHPELKSFVNFSLSDAEYLEFESWLKERKFTYSTDLETQATQLMETARDTRQFKELQQSLESIQGKISSNHAGYMMRFRDEIQPLLEEEIGFHAALHRGRVEAYLNHDKELLEAKRLISDPAAFDKLLQPH